MLEEYLVQLQQEGQADALEQNFSLDLLGQARKLAEFQFKQPALWLLKLVQAAVASGAPEACVTCTRDTLEVRFRPHWDQAIQFGPEAPGWVKHLHWGLLAALSLEPAGLDLSWKEHSLYSRGKIKGSAGQDLRMYLKRAARPFWHFVDRGRAEIAKTLAERCALCPIPVRLDQRVVNCLYLEKGPFALKPVKPAAMEMALSNYYWLVERSWFAQTDQARFALAPPAVRNAGVLEIQDIQLPRPRISYSPYSCVHRLDLDQPLLKLSGGASTQGLLILDGELSSVRGDAFISKMNAVRVPASQLTRVTAPARGFGRDLSSMACRRWVGLAAQSQHPGQIGYQQDGVLLNPIESKTIHPGTCAVIADSPITTDLSQLGVVEDETVESDRAWLLEEEARLFKQAQPIFLSTSEGEKRLLPLSIREHWRQRLSH